MTRKTKRAKSKVPQGGQVVGMMAPTRTSRLSSPVLVQDTIRLTKRIQLTVTVPEDRDALAVPIAALSTAIPGGLTYWSSIRIEKVDVFGSGDGAAKTDTITVILPSELSWGAPGMRWTDSGVPGNRRPHVGFRLGLLERSRFYSTASTDLLCSLSTDAVSRSLVFQATVELMSTQLP